MLDERSGLGKKELDALKEQDEEKYVSKFD